MALEPISSATPVGGDRVPFVERAGARFVDETAGGARFQPASGASFAEVERGGATFAESLGASFVTGPVWIVAVQGVPGELIVLPSVFPVDVGRTSFVGAGVAGEAFEHVVEITLPRPCNLHAMSATTDVGPGAGETFAYVVRKNQGDSPLSGSMAGAVRKLVMEGATVAYAKGDTLAVKITASVAAAKTHHRFVPDIEWL